MGLNDYLRPVVSIASAALGWYAGGPIGGAIGWGLGMGIGGALFPAEAERTAAQSMGPAQQLTPTASLGGVVPVVLGNRRIAGNLIWYDNAKEIPFESEAAQEGWNTIYTGIYGGTTSPGASYYIDFAIGVCIGPATILRFWIQRNEFIIDLDTNDIYKLNMGANVPVEYMNKTAAEILAYLKANGASTIFVPPITGWQIYTGTQTTADASIVASKGTAATPPYRNLCYIRFNYWPTSGLNVVPPMSFEVASFEELSPATCLEEIASTDTQVFAGYPSGKRMVILGNYLYVYYERAGAMVLDKIDRTTMTVTVSRTFSATHLKVPTYTCIINKDTSTVVLLGGGVSSNTHYLFEIDSDDLTTKRKLAIGYVVVGTDANNYVFKAGNQYSIWKGKIEHRPTDGSGDYTLGWDLLDADCDTVAEAWSTEVSAPTNETEMCASASGTKDVAYASGYYSTTGNGAGNVSSLISNNGMSSEGMSVLFQSNRTAIIGDTVYFCESAIKAYTLPGLVLQNTDTSIPYNIIEMKTEGVYLYVWYSDGTSSHVKKFDTSLTLLATYSYLNAAFSSITITPTTDYVLICGDRIRKLNSSDLTFVCDYNPGTETYFTGINDVVPYFYSFVNTVGWNFVVTQFSGIGSSSSNYDTDVTPQKISNAVMTNEFYGLGLDSAIYLESTITAAAEQYAVSNDLLYSVVFDTQRSILDVWQYIIQHHNGYVAYRNGQVIHGQLEIEGEAIAWVASTTISDAFTDNSTGTQWRKVE